MRRHRPVGTTSTKPYFLRALYEWCVDQGFTPYVSVQVDGNTVVPRQYVRDGQIIFNLGQEAVQQLYMGNDLISFQARFGVVAQAISIPVANISAIYARENGQGIAFEVEVGTQPETDLQQQPAVEGELVPTEPPPRPHLTRVK